jgi:DNA polymerase III delta subunit
MKSSAARSKAGSAGAARSRGPRAAATDALALIRGADAGRFPASLYLEGPSEALKAEALAALRAAWARHCPESPAARVRRAAENGVEEILAAFQGASLFSPRDLIVVLEVEDLGRSEKRVAALAAGIARPAGASSLVLLESAADAARKSLEPLRAACAARAVLMPPGRAELLAWGARRLAVEGIPADPGVMETVADACEGDAMTFFGELSKLCTLAGAGGRLTADAAAALMKPVLDADLPGYLAAVAVGEPRVAAQRLGRLLACGVGEGQVLFALSNLVGGALGGWARWRDLSARLRGRLSPRELSRALDAVYRAESAWKGGRADVVAVLEQATRDVCGAE